MKKVLVIAISALLIGFVAKAQKASDTKVPAVLKAAFAKQFPKATDVKWEKEGANYEVALNDNGKAMTVALDAKGTVIETEVGIKTTELPAAVLKYVADKYKGKTILSADKITAGTKVSYEVVVQKGKALMFDATGKFLKGAKD